MWKQLKHWWKAEGEWLRLTRLDARLLADMGLDRRTLRQRVMQRCDHPDLQTCGRESAGMRENLPLGRAADV